MTRFDRIVYNQLLELTREGLAAVDRDGRCVFINTAGARMLGVEPSDLIGADLHALIHAQRPDGGPCEEALCPLLAYRQGARVTVEGDLFWRANGESFPVEYSAMPIFDDDGARTGGILRFFDVTVQDRIERELRQHQAHRRTFFETSLDSIVTLDHEGRVVEFNPAAEQLFGYAADDVINTPMAERLIPAPWSDWFKRAFEEYRDTGRGPLEARRARITALRSSGASFPIELTVTRLPVEHDPVFTCYVRDITERSWSERRRNARYAVSRILMENEDREDAAARVMETISNGLDWDWAGYWVRDPRANEMTLDLVWRRDTIDASEFEATCRRERFTPGRGTIGRVWSRRQPAWIADIAASSEYQRAEIALAAGFRTAAAMPVLGRSDVIGVMEFLSLNPRRHDSAMLRLLESIGGQLGQFIERRQFEQERVDLLVAEQRARAEAEDAERRLSFLAEASARLSESLDYTETLASVAQLALSRIADYCAIEMVDEGGQIRLLEIADVDPVAEATGRALHEKYPTQLDSDSPVAEVIRTGRSILIPEVTDETLRRFSDDPEYQAALQGMRIDSAMYVPLVARGRTLGAISFVASESGYRYGPSDLALAEELARRAALATDNARLYQESRSAVRVREEFLSIASHELKTPLTTVKGYTQLLARIARAPNLDRERLNRLTNQLEAQLSRFETLISDLLDVSRIQQGRLQLRLEEVDLAQLARTVLSRFDAPSGQSPIHRLSFDTDGPAFVIVDPDRIDQVLTNLLSNAIKYSPNGGEIVVRVRAIDDEIELSVIDHGIGIGQADQARLFQPFSRSETVHRAISGEGLGLYITSQIVERHGGTIFVESDPGAGSTFVVRLPRNSDGNQASRPPGTMAGG